MNTARLALLLSSGWTPAKLFKPGDVGAYFLPSDFSSLYQDGSGVSSVTALAQTLGLVLDKQHALARGADELAATALTSADGWSPSAGVTVAYVGGAIEFTSTGAGTHTISPPLSGSLSADLHYEFIAEAGLGQAAGEFSSGFNTYFATTTAQTYETLRGIEKGGGSPIFRFVSTGAGETVRVRAATFRAVPGNHAVQATAGSRPALAAGGKIDYDGVDDSLVITFPSDMGTACTVARSVPQGEATILTGQTITTTYTDSTDHCGLVIINRALSATETNQLRRWLNRRAG